MQPLFPTDLVHLLYRALLCNLEWHAGVLIPKPMMGWMRACNSGTLVGDRADAVPAPSHLLCSAEDVVDKPVEGEASGHVQGEPT